MLDRDQITAEWMRRLRNSKRAERDLDFQRALQIHYKNNCVDWINDWCITYDPRQEPQMRYLPFRLFPRQAEFVECILECHANKEHVLCEKTRDMGATWIGCAITVWMWLYQEGSAIGWGSRKAEYVDAGNDMKAIFPKIRKIMEYLPSWMMPERWKPEKYSLSMRILNPDNGSTIIGESGDMVGRGNRTTIFFKDESAFYERPEMIEAALGDTTDVQIDISTVNGTGNVFYNKRMAGEVWEKGKEIERGITRVFIFDWRDHPAKTQEWYNMRRAQAERNGLLSGFLSEIERDYTGSVDKIIIRPEWVEASIDAHIKLGFEATGSVFCGQDVADEGGDKHANAIRKGVLLKHIRHWGGDPGEAATITLNDCKAHGVADIYYDSIGVGSNFKVAMNNLRDNGVLPKNLRVTPWNAGDSVLNPDARLIPNDRDSPTNADFFANLKAQAWWSLRTRFYKTYLAVTKGEQFHPDDLISIAGDIPFLTDLKRELSQAVYNSNNVGKTLVDKKANGAKSPNLADAVVICYFPNRKHTVFDSM